MTRPCAFVGPIANAIVSQNVGAIFVIRYESEIVGCGVNQFVKVDYGEDGASEWRIVSGIDVQAPRETCAGFKAKYKSRVL